MSQREKRPQFFSYKEFSDDFQWLDEKLVTMKPRQNNRDGASLRLIANKLSQESATTKLLISISDGQPKALPDYTGKKARKISKAFCLNMTVKASSLWLLRLDRIKKKSKRYMGKIVSLI